MLYTTKSVSSTQSILATSLLFHILTFFIFFLFFFNHTATTEIYTLSLHDALPISTYQRRAPLRLPLVPRNGCGRPGRAPERFLDRKSGSAGMPRPISYAVFCLKKKNEYAMGIKHQLTIGGRTKISKFPKRDQFAAELIYFSDCIVKNKEPEPSGLEGLADVRIVQAIYESARTRRIVELPELPAKKRPTTHQEIQRPSHEKPTTVHAKSPSGEAA